MTADTSAPPAPPKNPVRKTIFQLVAGALTGGIVTFGVLTALGSSGFDIDDPARVVALLTGLILALIGAMVGFGVLAPKAGSHLLNVEDADELREEARPLRRGSIIMLLSGLGLMALAVTSVGGEPGLFDARTGLLVAALLFVASTILGYRSRNSADELMLAMSREASAVAMDIITVIGLVWGIAAYFGYVGWIDPLGLLAGLFLVQLAAIFWVVAKRGMLKPR